MEGFLWAALVGGGLSLLIVWGLRHAPSIAHWPAIVRWPLAWTFLAAFPIGLIYVYRLNDPYIALGLFSGLLAGACWHRWRYGFWWDRYY